MPSPTKYTRQYDYASYQNANPTRPLPGGKVNADLNAVENSLRETIDFARKVIRDDGKLANGIVTPESLAPSVSLGFNPPSAWTALTPYVAGKSLVFSDSRLYSAAVSHTSETTFDPAKWTLLVDMTGVGNTPYAFDNNGFASLEGAIAALGSTIGTIVITKPYALTSNLTIPANVSLEVAAGGSITQSATYNLQINGPFRAAPSKVFFGFAVGEVKFGNNALPFAYVEWWGGDCTGATDSYPAITAALAAHHRVVLLVGSYLCNTMVNVPPNRTLEGTTECFQMTYVYTTSPIQTVIGIVGTTEPLGATPDSYNTRIKNLYVYRTVDPAPGAIGIKLYKTLRATVENCFVHGHERGVYVGWTVNTDLVKITVVGHGGTGTNLFYGFFIDCAVIGAVAPNASTRVFDCGTSGTPPGGTSYGFYIDGRYSDQFLTRCESAANTYGFYVKGTNDVTERIVLDLHLNGCIADSFTGFGFVIQNGSRYSAVQLTDCYAAGSSGAFGEHLQIENSNGTIVHSFQAIGVNNTGGGRKGLYLLNSSYCSISGFYAQDCKLPVVVSGCSNCFLQGTVYNGAQAVGQTQTVAVGTTNRSKFDFAMGGAATGQFTVGYDVDAASAHNEFCVSTIDGPGLSVIDKIHINGANVTSAGLTGTNLVSGVIG